MRGLLITIGVGLFLLWSAFVYAAHLLFRTAGKVGSRNADVLPVDPEWVVLISEALGAIASASGPVATLIWAIGSAVILGLTALATALAGRLDARTPPDGTVARRQRRW